MPEPRRGYEEGGLVLHTEWKLGRSRCHVTDALAWDGPQRLLRLIEAHGGPVEVVIRFAPAFDAGLSAARIEFEGARLVASGSGVAVAVTAPAPWRLVAEATAEARATIVPGGPGAVVLSAADDVVDLGEAPRVVAATQRAWMEMLSVVHPFPSALAARTLAPDTVTRLLRLSAAVLLGLRLRDGGIVAAPTTSLPQWPGSSRTWDYRYCWLRDGSLAARALLRLGFVDQAAQLGDFIGTVVVQGGARALVCVDGSPPPPERTLDHLEGYHGARPVRIGNAAAAQAQLDVGGEVIELAEALAVTGALPESLRGATSVLADWIALHWTEPDHGIWEIRGRPRRYSHSRLLAWLGVKSAARLARQGIVDGDAANWEMVGKRIRRSLLRTARSHPAMAVQLHSRGGGADSGMALAALLDFVPSADARIAATLDVIERELDRNGLLDRYLGQQDEIADPCAPFVFPTFWVASALEACGRDGSRHFSAACCTRGELDLFGEVADPRDHGPLGNYPQVQSHAAFVLAATEPVSEPARLH